jgi:hypothetical protein
VAILSAGLYIVGSRVETQAKIKLTESTIQMLSAAIEQYHDFYKSFPDPNATGYPTGCTLPIERLYNKLSTAPDAKIILGQINSSLIKDADKNGHPLVVDAWGNYLHYTYDPNSNFPVIDSNGPDKVRGDSDDITSRKL